MMKIVSWILAASVMLTQSHLFSAFDCCPRISSSEYFEGFDIDIGVGYSSLTLITTRGGIKPASHTNYGGDGVAAQLKVAGNYAFCGMGLIGLEAFGQYNSAETENRFFETVASATETDRRFRMKWNLGFDLRLGVSPCPSNLIFIYGGPDWGYHDFHYATTGVNSRYQEFRIGGVLGAGLEQIIANCWVIKGTFDYRWYPSKTLSYANGEQQTIKARQGTALFMLGHLF